MGSDLVCQVQDAYTEICDTTAVHPVTPGTLTIVLLVRPFLLLENNMDELEFKQSFLMECSLNFIQVDWTA